MKKILILASLVASVAVAAGPVVMVRAPAPIIVRAPVVSPRPATIVPAATPKPAVAAYVTPKVKPTETSSFSGHAVSPVVSPILFTPHVATVASTPASGVKKKK